MELDVATMAKYRTYKKDATVRTKVGLNLDYASSDTPDGTKIPLSQFPSRQIA